MSSSPANTRKKPSHKPKGSRVDTVRKNLRTASLDKTPWIDFLAAGIEEQSGYRTGWVAFINSAPRLVQSAHSIRNRTTSQIWQFTRSERASTAYRILFGIHSSMQTESPEFVCDIPQDLHAIHTAYFHNIVSGRNDGTENIAFPDSSLISWGATPKTPADNSAGLKAFHFESFEMMLEFVFAPLRLHFGAGWLTNSANFFLQLESARKNKNESVGMVTARPASADHSPPEMAALATARLVSFGWLPLNWNCRAAMMGDAIAAPLSGKAEQLRMLFDEGIRIFDLPRIPFKSMTSLNVADQSELVDVAKLHFTSKSRNDRVLLAIEFIGYGKRKKKPGSKTGRQKPTEGECEDDEVTGKYFLYRLPLNAVSVIQTLLPWVRTTVISYSEAASATSRAGVLARLIRHYLIAPRTEGFRDQIIREIRSSTYPYLPRHSVSLPGYERLQYNTRIDLCGHIDALSENIIHSGSPSGSSRIDTGLNNKPNPHQAVVSEAESSESRVSPPIREISELMPNLLPLGSSSAAKSMEETSEKQPEQVKKELSLLDREVRDNADEITRIQLTRTAHFRPLTLFRSILQFLHGAKHLRLEVPEFLQRWIGSMFRFVWVIPLEPMGALHTCMENPRFRKPSAADDCSPESEPGFYRSSYAGSPVSPRVYPMLFSPTPCEFACEVNLERLLGGSEHIGLVNEEANWLLNRISQTNELMEKLRRNLGYSPDFEPSLTHGSPNARKRLLVSQPSETIIRLILLQDGGKEMLQAWSYDLMHKIHHILQEKSDRNPSAHKTSTKAGNATDSNGRRNTRVTGDLELGEPLEQLRIFEDACGIATAALDCCRNKLAASLANGGDETDTNLTVFLLAGRLNRHFRPRVSHKSHGTQEYDDGRASGGRVAGSIRADNEIANIDVLLIKCFKAPSFDLVKDIAVDLLRKWHEKEGQDLGEKPEDLLREIADEMFDGPPPGDFIEKQDAILKQFHRS